MLKKGIYIEYFWKYATKEEIEDILSLSIENIAEYIIIIGKQIYNSKKNQSIFAKKTYIKSIIK